MGAHLRVAGQDVGEAHALLVARQRGPALGARAAPEDRLDAPVEVWVQAVDEHHAGHLARCSLAKSCALRPPKEAPTRT